MPVKTFAVYKAAPRASETPSGNVLLATSARSVSPEKTEPDRASLTAAPQSRSARKAGRLAKQGRWSYLLHIL